ncbi:MAG: hypothetical protein KTR31_34590 [Myxococcales bacterium]|nr:hypothetical protein [Myxococcales bacterium]
MTNRTTPLVMGAAAVALLALAYLALRPPSTEVSTAPTSGQTEGTPATADGSIDAPPVASAAPREEARTAGPAGNWQPPPNLARAPSPDAPPPSDFPELDGQTSQPPRTPAAEAVALLVQETALHVLTTVDPDLAAEDVTSWCTSDGTTCKLQGPWPGDDFGVRWMSALGTGRIEEQDYENVVFQRFSPVEVDGERRFEAVVRAQ